MSSNEHCLINQTACGRIAGNPVCPKCGMDERIVFPSEADRDGAVRVSTMGAAAIGRKMAAL